MKKIAVTGATGFIGKAVVEELLFQNYKVLAITRNIKKAQEIPILSGAELLETDISSPSKESIIEIAKCDGLIHLAWEGLSNYWSLVHLEENVIQHYFFIKKIVEHGLINITITGTCLEYGLKEGCLSSSMTSDPITPYALAKDTLRKFLQHLQNNLKFNLKWLRVFYVYGMDQNPKSLYPQLLRAIEGKDHAFPMSMGNQIRDFISIKDLTREILNYSLEMKGSGVFNACSGNPQTVLNFVMQQVMKMDSNIKIELGVYQIPKYEPFAFWGAKN